eukprot:scaffold5041_cov76-Skeletonema_marinoi.AAC.2
MWIRHNQPLQAEHSMERRKQHSSSVSGSRSAVVIARVGSIVQTSPESLNEVTSRFYPFSKQNMKCIQCDDS